MRIGRTTGKGFHLVGRVASPASVKELVLSLPKHDATVSNPVRASTVNCAIFSEGNARFNPDPEHEN